LEAGEAGEITIAIWEELEPLSLCPVGGAGTDRSLLEMDSLSMVRVREVEKSS